MSINPLKLFIMITFCVTCIVAVTVLAIVIMMLQTEISALKKSISDHEEDIINLYQRVDKLEKK